MKYPGALSLASTIVTKIAQGESLEHILRSMLNDGDEHVLHRLGQVPFYFQELFGEISGKYAADPVNYSRLLTEILGSTYEKVALVTLNYDLFLEKALASVEQGRVNSLDAYIQPNRKWMLVKLHGSVNWGRLVPGEARTGSDHAATLELASSIPFEKSRPDRIYQLSDHHERWRDNKFLCPAMILPQEGKYDYLCPEPHVTALTEFLPSCRNFLIIGVSGKDDDLLRLLEGGVHICERVAIVGGSDVAEVRDRFYSTVPQFLGGQVELRHDGFSSFILTGQLDAFLSSLAD